MSDFVIPETTDKWTVADHVADEVGRVVGWAIKADNLGDIRGLPIYVTSRGTVQTPQRKWDGHGPTINRDYDLNHDDEDI